MNEETGGTVVYTEIQWREEYDVERMWTRLEGVMYYGYGKGVVSIDNSKHIVFTYAGERNLRDSEAGIYNAESQMAQVVVEYVEKLGAKDAMCRRDIKRGDSVFIPSLHASALYYSAPMINPCLEIEL